MVGRLKGYKITVVMPENVSEERTQLLAAYGAEIISSDGSLGTNGAIDVAHDLIEKHPHDYFMMYQYGNSGNPDAHYEGTGQEIVETLPEVDMFVAGLGTGGTLMGVGRRLKEHNQNIKVVAVAPEPDDFISGLRRLEDGFIPPILDRTGKARGRELTCPSPSRWLKKPIYERGVDKNSPPPLGIKEKIVSPRPQIFNGRVVLPPPRPIPKIPFLDNRSAKLMTQVGPPFGTTEANEVIRRAGNSHL